MKVLWTNSALAQLEAIRSYMAQTSPEYALRIVGKPTKRSLQLAAFPFSGAEFQNMKSTVRELIEGPYRLIYLIQTEKDEIEVLAVIHSAREELKPLN